LERVGVLGRDDVLQRSEPQLRVLVAVDGRQEERAFELSALVEVQHRACPSPATGRDARTGERSPLNLLAVVEVLDCDPPQLPLEDLDSPVLLGTDRDHPSFDAYPAAATAP